MAAALPPALPLAKNRVPLDLALPDHSEYFGAFGCFFRTLG